MKAAVRHLATPPSRVVDTEGAPCFGSFRGPLPQPVDLSVVPLRRFDRLAKEKRWMYVAIAAEPLLLGIAVVDLGYVANAFAFVFDRDAGRLVVDDTALGAPLSGSVNDLSGEGHRALFSWRRTNVRIERARGGTAYDVDVDTPDLTVRARADASSAPPPISAIARIDGGIVNATEKGALLGVTGEAVVRGARRSLDGGLAGYDYTHGLLARKTEWKWAFLQGRATTGEKVAVNLVQGFVGEPECAVWVDGELFGVSEGRFEHDAAHPERPWRVSSARGEVRFDFEPGGVHAEHRNYVVVASRFVQPMGVFRGTIALGGGRELAIDRALGVTEDQSVVW